VTVQSVRLIPKASTISVAVPISDTVGVSVTAAIRVGVAIAVPISVSIAVPAPSTTAGIASASAASATAGVASASATSATAGVASASTASPAAASASAAVTRAGAGAIAATAGARTIITALGARHGDDEPAESILNGIAEVGSKRENDNRNENEHHGILNGGHPALPDSRDTMLECVYGFHALCSCSHAIGSLPLHENVLPCGPSEGHADCTAKVSASVMKASIPFGNLARWHR
jgi:hypothetical protein